jgi:hypothetical protein
VAVGAAEGLGRHPAEAAIAAPRRHHVGDQVVHGEMAQRGQAAVEQRQVDMLAGTAVDVAVIEGGLDGVGRVEAGQDVDHRQAHLHRSAAGLVVGIARGAHHAAHGLEHAVIAGLGRQGAGLAKAGDRAVDQARIDRLQALVVQAVLLQRPGLEVLQHDVGLGGQAADDLLPLGGGEIGGHRALVAVGAEIEGGVRGRRPVAILQEGRAVFAGFVADAGPLDLDDLGAQIAQHLGGERRGQNTAEVQHLDAIQRLFSHALRSRRHFNMPAWSPYRPYLQGERGPHRKSDMSGPDGLQSLSRSAF